MYFQRYRDTCPLAEGLSGFGNSVHAARFLECWSLVRPGRHHDCRYDLHVLCSYTGQMFAHPLPTGASSLARFLRRGRNRFSCWPRSTAQMVSIRTVHHQLFPRHRPHRLLLCLQCVCGHQPEASGRVLFWRETGHSAVHCYVVDSVDPDEPDSKPQVPGTVLDDRQYFDGCWDGHYHVLLTEWYSVD